LVSGNKAGAAELVTPISSPPLVARKVFGGTFPYLMNNQPFVRSSGTVKVSARAIVIAMIAAPKMIKPDFTSLLLRTLS
jgi:hypothetical protein